MPVTHCLCVKKSIAELLRWAEANDAHRMEQLAEAHGCTTHCGLCEPFLRYALATGIAVVPYPCPPLPLESGNPS